MTRCIVPFIILLLSTVQAEDKSTAPRMKYTVSKETTFVLGPLRPDGTIDYVAALNERCSQGVTSENNALVLLVHAFGPKPDRTAIPASYFAQLGCPPPSAEGAYFISDMHFLREKLGNDYDDKERQRFEMCRQAPWSPQNYPLVKEWLDRNAVALGWVEKACKRTRYYHPMVIYKQTEYPGLWSAVRPYEFVIFGPREALLTRAMLHLHQNQLQAALHDLLTLKRLGWLLNQGPTLIDLLMGLAADSMMHEGMMHWLAHPQMTDALLVELRDQLQSMPPRASVVEKFKIGERFNFLDGMMLTGTGGLPFLERLAGGGLTKPSTMTSVVDALFFRNIPWDPALRAGNEWMDRIVNVLSISDPVQRRLATADLVKEIASIRDGISGDLMTYIKARGSKVETRSLVFFDLLRCLITPAALKVQTAVDKVDAKQRLLLIAIALERYHRQQHRYPAKLDELCPRFMPTIPHDLFTGKSPRYMTTAKGYQLYSVGPNREDDGGLKDDSGPSSVDLLGPLPKLKLTARTKDDIALVMPPALPTKE